MHTNTIERTASAVATKIINTGVCAGTTIMTLKGEMKVEDLQAGDKIITRDSGMAVLRDIREATSMMQPIRVKAGSLGHTRPDRDMMVTPNTRIHIRDWRAEALFGAPTAKVSAKQLVDGEFLAQQDNVEMTTYALIFDREHVLYADGLEIVSSPL